MRSKIFLLPTYIDIEHLDAIPEETRLKTAALKYLIVENVRTTRRYLKRIDPAIDIDAIKFIEWDKHDPDKDLEAFLQPAIEGNDMGLISEAGCPGIADPGQAIVAVAHRLGFKVVPMSGPSSIFLALMASGMNGQKFTFHGYLPIDDGKKRKFIRYMESEASQRKETQIFMETPYRNNKIIQALVKTLQDGTLLCLAANISGENEFIQTKTVKEWKTQIPDLHKQPAIFLIL